MNDKNFTTSCPKIKMKAFETLEIELLCLTITQ